MSQIQDLDYDRASEMQMSYDAYLFLRDGEWPLDEDNLEEAEEIKAMFEHGLFISDEFVHVEDSDMVEVMVIPYAAPFDDYDMSMPMFNKWHVRFKYIDGGPKIKLWFYRETGETHGHVDVEIVRNPYGKMQIQTGPIGKGCVFYLHHFKKRV